MKKDFLPAIILIGSFLLNVHCYGQSKTAHGYVSDLFTNKLIDSAEIRVEYTDTKVFTDKYGSFEIEVKKKNQSLLIQKEGFSTQKIALGPDFQNKMLLIKLELGSDQIVDSIARSYKNAVSLSLLELINVTIGLRYERFLSQNQKHSIGVHASFCLYGRNPITMGSEYDVYVSYSGIKLSPFYRYFPIRKASKGIFIEGKMHMGYYHFNNIRYTYGSNSYPVANVSMDTWSIGGGIAVGAMLKLPKTDRGLINISIGYQYFPLDMPETVQREISNGTVLTFKTDPYWWYFTGPGAVFELKFTIGGLF